MLHHGILCLVLLTLHGLQNYGGFAQKQSGYRMCVPHKYHQDCLDLMLQFKQQNKGSIFECVPARDRVECLSKVINRKADVLAADPEDMYIAYHMNNQDFLVFSEIRTRDEPQNEFRYEGIILVHKDSNIHKLSDLKGKKSCHTGYGRNVGYKIPITKLEKHGLFKKSLQTDLTPVEKELKALSEFFSSSCLVGKYSPDPEVDAALKKTYSNLCALCEEPLKCMYPDKYSGYDGAIRCLVENNGDVAFTKVIYVKKYFGLPLVPNSERQAAQSSANPNDYEYLCEDGSRRPVTQDRPCSWAQRPWQGYMSNSDNNDGLKFQKLQENIQLFFDDGKTIGNNALAAKLWIKPENVVISKSAPIFPGEHLTKAQYKDVIERDGTEQTKIKFCVTSDIEMKKCDVLKRAAYSRDIRPEIVCLLKGQQQCEQAVHDGVADVVVVSNRNKGFENARNLHLKAIMYEKYDENDVTVAVVDKYVSDDIIRKANVKFDSSDERMVDAVLYFNEKRMKKVCPSNLKSDINSPIQFVNANELNKFSDKDILCRDLSHKSTTEFRSCHFEYAFPRALFARDNLSENEIYFYTHCFTDISKSFGKNGKFEDVFEVFYEFEPTQKNVIFNDRTTSLETESNTILNRDETFYNQLHCL